MAMQGDIIGWKLKVCDRKKSDGSEARGHALVTDTAQECGRRVEGLFRTSEPISRLPFHWKKAIVAAILSIVQVGVDHGANHAS